MLERQGHGRHVKPGRPTKGSRRMGGKTHKQAGAGAGAPLRPHGWSPVGSPRLEAGPVQSPPVGLGTAEELQAVGFVAQGAG